MESAESSAESSSSAEAERTKRSGLAPLGGVLQVNKKLNGMKRK